MQTTTDDPGSIRNRFFRMTALLILVLGVSMLVVLRGPLESSLWITGRVVDENGDGLSPRQVSFCLVDSGGVDGASTSTFVAADGQFDFEFECDPDFGHGRRLRVRCQEEGFVDFDEVFDVADVHVDLVIRLEAK